MQKNYENAHEKRLMNLKKMIFKGVEKSGKDLGVQSNSSFFKDEIGEFENQIGNRPKTSNAKIGKQFQNDNLKANKGKSVKKNGRLIIDADKVGKDKQILEKQNSKQFQSQQQLQQFQSQQFSSIGSAQQDYELLLQQKQQQQQQQQQQKPFKYDSTNILNEKLNQIELDFQRKQHLEQLNEKLKQEKIQKDLEEQQKKEEIRKNYQEFMEQEKKMETEKKLREELESLKEQFRLQYEQYVENEKKNQQNQQQMIQKEVQIRQQEFEKKEIENQQKIQQLQENLANLQKQIKEEKSSQQSQNQMQINEDSLLNDFWVSDNEINNKLGENQNLEVINEEKNGQSLQTQTTQQNQSNNNNKQENQEQELNDLYRKMSDRITKQQYTGEIASKYDSNQTNSNNNMDQLQLQQYSTDKNSQEQVSKYSNFIVENISQNYQQQGDKDNYFNEFDQDGNIEEEIEESLSDKSKNKNKNQNQNQKEGQFLRVPQNQNKNFNFNQNSNKNQNIQDIIQSQVQENLRQSFATVKSYNVESQSHQQFQAVLNQKLAEQNMKKLIKEQIEQILIEKGVLDRQQNDLNNQEINQNQQQDFPQFQKPVQQQELEENLDLKQQKNQDVQQNDELKYDLQNNQNDIQEIIRQEIQKYFQSQFQNEYANQLQFFMRNQNQEQINENNDKKQIQQENEDQDFQILEKNVFGKFDQNLLDQQFQQEQEQRAVQNDSLYQDSLNSQQNQKQMGVQKIQNQSIFSNQVNQQQQFGFQQNNNNKNETESEFKNQSEQAKQNQTQGQNGNQLHQNQNRFQIQKQKEENILNQQIRRERKSDAGDRIQKNFLENLQKVEKIKQNYQEMQKNEELRNSQQYKKMIEEQYEQLQQLQIQQQILKEQLIKVQQQQQQQIQSQSQSQSQIQSQDQNQSIDQNLKNFQNQQKQNQNQVQRLSNLKKDGKGLRKSVQFSEKQDNIQYNQQDYQNEDLLEETQKFDINDEFEQEQISQKIWKDVLTSVKRMDIEDAYQKLLNQEDDLLLIRLMSKTGPCLQKLGKITRNKLIQRVNELAEQNIIGHIGINMIESCLESGVVEHLQQGQNQDMLQILYDLSSSCNPILGPLGAKLFCQLEDAEIQENIQQGLMGCQADPSLCDEDGGVCNVNGFCECNTNYYGTDCSSEISKSDQVDFKSGGLASGGIAGLVIAWIFLPILLYMGGVFLVWKFTN
ncbi:hypothetical protein PPERSA_03748 [Pseudocohnilembus persalinus]|uniref:EGF-like domain-containing protein n=1 Tax=Pseudocohnilembus persalinus TaxID=266149 RepID=A0A0V0QHY5_PSEPJ|nr:hypothetical protein PPERSA_03748 [Pseudocohnilembus persalinus]|eukprot:KRX01664.1 hypothetical protein PPERSA_03748 [Pseudocohnilembus persalinus]